MTAEQEAELNVFRELLALAYPNERWFVWEIAARLLQGGWYLDTQALIETSRNLTQEEDEDEQ